MDSHQARQSEGKGRWAGMFDMQLGRLALFYKGIPLLQSRREKRRKWRVGGLSLAIRS